MLKLLLGDPNTRKLKRYQPIVEEINLLEEEVSSLTDDELRNETQNLKSKVSSSDCAISMGHSIEVFQDKYLSSFKKLESADIQETN